jgi:hypothetical protein
MSDAQATKEVATLEEQAVEQAKELPKMPEPVATGDERIAVLKHLFSGTDGEHGEGSLRVDLAIRNVSDLTIATAVFEAVFYDIEGNVVDTVKHDEIELRPETSRLIHITSSLPIFECDEIKSYAVRLVRMTTADVEKVQLRRYEIVTIETGEEQVTGVVKNISEVKTDAAVVVTFYDADKANVGVRVLALRDIEPNTARQYDLRFRPQDGDTVSSCSIIVGEIADNCG